MAAIDGTPEGLAVAAATRDALSVVSKKRKSELPPSEDAPSVKKIAVPPPTCVHEVQRPEGFKDESIDLDEAVYGTLDAPAYTGEPAKRYPFELDPFQRTAAACIERRESVLVAAHTSAGKTAVAEYAIAAALRAGQRVAYTSPIKALSNQKYRELAAAFGDVGLVTGDITLNPDAAVVVMTTEILRAMIYRGGALLREAAWVIFDEVHYMQDRERGVVWEETIVFLDPAVRMVFLSATLPNARDFAAWVAHLHKRPCHVVSTDYRPTPLRHYALPSTVAGAGLYLLKDVDGKFRKANFDRMRAAFEEADAEEASKREASRGSKADKRRMQRSGGASAATTTAATTTASGSARALQTDAGGGGGDEPGDGGDGDGESAAAGGKRSVMSKKEQREAARCGVKQLVQHMRDGALASWPPAIFFSFSKIECEDYARAVYAPQKGEGGGGGGLGLCFTTADERAEIELVFDNAVQCLPEEDRDLPPVKALRGMLAAGVGVHHGGLLPLMKEVVELLFGEGLLRLLFTTETFAMGLNMPARTVVFTSLTKWDGIENRTITSGEYIQMAGRAGRRGKDARGHVVVLADKALEEKAAAELMTGDAAPLASSFRLSYYTLLNLLKHPEEGLSRLEYIIARSFRQFQSERGAPSMKKELAEIEAKLNKLDAGAAAAIEQYTELKARLASAERVVRAHVLRPDRVLGFLRPGRLVRVVEGATDWGWGVVVSVMRRPSGGHHHAQQQQQQQQQQPNGGATAAAAASDPAEWYIVDTLLACAPGSVKAGAPRPAAAGATDGDPVVLPVALPLLAQVGSLRVALPADLRPADARRAVMLSLRAVADRYPDGLPRLDPIEDMGLGGDLGLREAVRDAEAAAAALADNPVFQAERDRVRFAAYKEQAELLAKAAKLRGEIRGDSLAEFRRERDKRTAVLRRLGFLTPDNLVTPKGLAAACVDAADELVAAELMFNGTFLALAGDPPRLAALVSCLIPVERTNDEIQLSATLVEPLAELRGIARMVADVSLECGLDFDGDPEAYVDGFAPTLMDVTYRWAKGASFADICGLTELFEGSVVRAMRRLDELLGQLGEAAADVGDTGLKAAFASAQAAIRRGACFCASLYL